MDCIIGEINESETTTLSLTKEFPNDTPMEPVIQQKVKTETYDDNLHVDIKSEIHEMPTGSIKTETFDDCEDSLSCEASILNDEDDGKDDNDDDDVDDDIVMNFIKDEIDIDETPIFKETFSSDRPIPDTPVQPVIPKADTVNKDVENDGDDDDDENEVGLIDFIKDEIDIDKTPIFKREFSSSIPDTPVQSVIPKANRVNEDVENNGDDDENEVGLIDFIKDEIDIDETPIFKREFSSSIPDTPVQPVIPKANRVNEDVENNGDDDENEVDLIDFIKDEIDIDETPIFKREFSSSIPDTPVQPVILKADRVNEDVENDGDDDDDDENEVGLIDFIKDEIDIDETPIIKREFSSSIPDTPVQPVIPKADRVNEDVENDGDDDDDDENEVGLIDFIKDEIDIDETPIFKREFSSSIPDTPVLPVIPKANRVNEVVENDLIDSIKDEIDIDETPILKKEFLSGIPDTPVRPVMPKSEPLESNISWESLQYYSNMELEICGRIAVVRLCRWEVEEHNLIVTKSEPSDCEQESGLKERNSKNRIVYPRRARRSAIREDSSDDNHGPVEDGPALKSLREYRMTRATPTREQDTTVADGGSDCGNIKHRNIKTYICGKCKFMCHTKTSLEIHLKKHNGKECVCDICQYVAPNIHTFKIHYRIHTGEKPYKCDMCDYKCAQKPRLVRHKRTHTGERPYGCTVCGSKFSDSGDLTRHMRMHTGEKPYSCNICHFKFSQSYHLREHVETHTRDPEGSSNFTDPGSVTKHMRIHNGNAANAPKRISRIRKKTCKVCHLEFSSSHFKDHERIHTGVKPFHCDMCEFKSFSSSYLKKHYRSHTGDYLRCTECDYKSAYSSDLSKHRKIHASEKRYRCDTCGYRCIRFNHLKQHIRRHTGEKPYSCEQCDWKFTTSSGLNDHRKKHRKA